MKTDKNGYKSYNFCILILHSKTDIFLLINYNPLESLFECILIS